MTDLSRLCVRLRRHLLRGYEFSMVGLLLGIAVAALLPAQPGSAGGPDSGATQCGKKYSSTDVIIR